MKNFNGKNLFTSKKIAFTKPSRGTNEVRDEHQSTETLSFRCWCERCRLMRGAAFTLAEVLITLGIIGIVAALTMHSLVANFQKQQTLVRLKKSYSELFQAIKLSEVEFGVSEGLSQNETNWLGKNSDFLENYLGKSIKFIKTCIPTSDTCWKMPEKDLTSDKVFSTDRYKRQFVSAVTADGYSIYLWVGGVGENGHTHVFIDIDGPNKGKQVLGKDIFRAYYEFKTNGTSLYKDKTRDTLLQECKDKDQCLSLIMLDGWTISSDYPHKF